ncbi:MAG TPA: HAD hydrolase family protein [Prolixibacteraceae bacterium]|jgi:3-deoxy-D-manno-octulosonate 8-phosphate phosphatase (KDO 8-P phosphatase)|nr:HAD hydrolase family protein [Prolixibacteraceae bacterium]HPR84733.1 HAD hydrolase family protein [Prolixibacteraceae bacterium]
MTFFKEKLKNVKAFIFDVDGVLSLDTSALDEYGDPVRTANVKDGFAIRYALKNGFQVAIITGANTVRVKLRYSKLGVEHIYLNSFEKLSCLNDILDKTGLKKSEILYMGDDLVDLPVMKEIGIPTCPSDAVPEVKAAAIYISDRKGGEGCVRDVIEQVLRSQGKWASQEITGLKAD